MSQIVAETRYGRLRGEAADGVFVFRGIPYAAPPVGPLRFRPPEPLTPWRRVHDATRFGPMAPQDGPAHPLLAPRGESAWSENCLTLNLWTTGLDRPRRPVFVWLHGGGFRSGTGSSALYDGASLARAGDLVVVTLNYRLGALGFLSHPDLRDEQTGVAGNWGLLDQLQALDWLADCVTAFGGDPLNVTLAGESAGAASVATLMGTPSAQGLFQRAVVQSGHPLVRTEERAARAAEGLLRELGLQSRDFAALRDVPARAVLEAQARCSAQFADGAQPLFGPTLDGGLLARSPLEEIGDGLSKGLPLLVGTNRDEWNFFGRSDPQRLALDERALLARLEQLLPGEHQRGTRLATLVLETYRRSRARAGLPSDPWALWSAIQSDRLFRVPAMRFATVHTRHERATFSYRFDWASPAAGGFGACHGLEIPFALGTLDQPGVGAFAGAGSAAARLGRRMQRAWILFAHLGDPGHDDLPGWPLYERQRRGTLIFDDECQVAEAPDDETRALWEEVLAESAAQSTTSISSTSNESAAPGAMFGGAPRLP